MSTLQDYVNDASYEQWQEWEAYAAKLEITVDYYVQEFLQLVEPCAT